MKRLIITSSALALIAFGGCGQVHEIQVSGGGGSDKLPICHVPPGNPSAAHIIYPDDSGYNGHHPGAEGHGGDFFVDDNHSCPPSHPTTTHYTPRSAPSTSSSTSPTTASTTSTTTSATVASTSTT